MFLSTVASLIMAFSEAILKRYFTHCSLYQTSFAVAWRCITVAYKRLSSESSFISLTRLVVINSRSAAFILLSKFSICSCKPVS